MSRRISLLTQRTALFLLSPSPVPSFLSPPPFLRLSPSLCLSFSNTTYRHSNSPLPSVQRRYPRPRHRQPLHPRNCGHNVSSRTNDQRYMYNSAGYGIGKEYRGPRLCEKRDFFFPPRRLRRSHLRTLSPVRARNRWCETTSVVIDDNDHRNRFKISLNTNAKRAWIGKIEICNCFFVSRREIIY